jgi:hypothetical protein
MMKRTQQEMLAKLAQFKTLNPLLPISNIVATYPKFPYA